MNINIIFFLLNLNLNFFTSLGFIKFKKLPIVKKYNNINKTLLLLDKKEKFNKDKYLASMVITHGFTDIIQYNKLQLINKYTSSLFINSLLNNHCKYILLFICSIYHFSYDMFFLNSYKIKLFVSFLLHFTFIYYPNFAFKYLVFYHTPLHYYTFYNYFTIKSHFTFSLFIIGLLTNIIYLLPFKYYNPNLLFPVIGHIFLHSQT